MTTQLYTFTRSAVCAALLLAAGAARAQQFTALSSFANNHGGITDIQLVQASNGLFYGTTYNGGTNGLGSVFSVDATGGVSTLYHFVGDVDDAYPRTGLIQGRDGLLYGTTSNTIFSLSTNGALTTVAGLTNLFSLSDVPVSLLQGSDSNLYGVVYTGGPTNGAVFKCTLGGALSLLYAFPGNTNGAMPAGRLVQGSDGTLYGTTTGGTTNGSVFKLTTNGVFTLLHAFAGGAEGKQPWGGVTFANDGNLYGTTSTNGANGCGTVFRCATNGTFATVYSFGAGGPGNVDAKYPRAGLTLGFDGMLYGTTIGGGASSSGTVYRITTNGVETVLFSFAGDIDGSRPFSSVTRASDGSYWGCTTAGGGAAGLGTIFELQVPVTITVVGTPAGSGTVGGGGTYYAGDTMTLYGYPTYGWALTNWNDGSTDNPYTLTVPPVSTAYTGTFVLAHGTITVLANPAAGGIADGTGTYLVDSNVVISATAASGYVFVDWSDGVTASSRYVKVPTNAATYYANFIPTGAPPATVSVTLRSNPPQVGSVSGGGTALMVGSARQLSATPAWANWVFSSWSDGNTDNPRIITVPGSNVTYLANFTLTGGTLATITVAANPVGSCTLLGGGTFTVGYPVLLSATPLPGYIFLRWNDNDPNPQRYVTVAGAATYTAICLPIMAPLGLQASPAYGGTAVSTGSFRVASSVTITATPTNGWTFAGWNDGTNTASRIIIMPAGGTNFVASFMPTLVTALGASNLTFTTGGNANWYGQWQYNHDGRAAASSGVIGTNQSSWLQTTTNGAGSILFWWKASSETNHDFLSFIADGTTNQISGQADWSQYVYFFGAGSHTFRWLYSKDASGADGTDAGYLDQVQWAGCPAATNKTQLLFQNPSGILASWVLNDAGAYQFSRLLFNLGTTQVKTAGDVDGDGVSDLLLQTFNGDVIVWFMKPDGTVRSTRVLGNTAGWVVKACADFNADLQTEIFFQTPGGTVAYWLIDTNGTPTNSVFFGNMGGWRLQGAADLSRNHKAEIFWQDPYGTTAVWFHTNSTIRAQILGNMGDWNLRGVLPADTNGVANILWQTSAGDTASWIINSNAVPSGVRPYGTTSGWQLNAAGR